VGKIAILTSGICLILFFAAPADRQMHVSWTPLVHVPVVGDTLHFASDLSGSAVIIERTPSTSTKLLLSNLKKSY
jgi:hypothetical protein